MHALVVYDVLINSIKLESVHNCTSLLNECLWYDKLLELSQRVVTLFFKVLVVMGAVGWWVL